ncbi:MAG: Gfo/Idh/MocA family oxidoreductase [Opitutales bacterium]
MERRDFLKTTAAGAGLMFIPSLAKANKKLGANDVINYALVGVGAEGKVLMQSLVKMPNLNCVAICDIWDFPRKYGAAYHYKMAKMKKMPNMYEDYKELIEKEKDLDAVIIATPDFWHAPQTNDFLKAGVHVYCEKMMAESKESAATMVRTARETGKLLQIGHQRTSNPYYNYAREELIQNRQIFGRLVNANGQWNRAVTDDLVMPEKHQISQEILTKYGFKDAHQFMNWRWYKGLGGGPISDLGAHQIDIFGWFFGGRPIDVMASGDCSYYNKEWYDNVMCILNYKTFQGHTAKAFYQVLTATSAGGGYYEQFMGDEGAIKISENDALTKIFKEGRADKDKWDKLVDQGVLGADTAPAVAVTKTDSRQSGPLASYAMPASVKLDMPIHMAHLLNFFNAIRGQEKLNCDGEHAFEREAAVFKIVEAIEAKKTLQFEESDFVA